jgi:hypothetical protein
MKVALKYGTKYPVRFVFIAALLTRIPVWLIVSAFFDGHLFGDDQMYLKLIEAYGQDTGASWDNYQSVLWSKSLSFLLPAGTITKIIGFHPLVILFISVLVGSALAALVTFIALKHVSGNVALAISIAFALMPSQVLWSSLILKDSYIALGGALLALVLYRKKQNGFVFYGSSFFMIFLLLLFIQRIRVHTLMVVCIALVLTALSSSGSHKILRTGFAVSMLALMPWLISGDVGGVAYIKTLTGGMEDQRLAGTVGAKTSVVDTKTSVVDTKTSVVDATTTLSPSSPDPLDRLYEETKYLPSGLKVMLLDPTIPQLGNSRSLYLPFAEHLIWYPVLLLAFYGALKTRRWTDDLIFAGFLFLGSATMWSLTEGNFGTAYRHRTEFVWIVFLFAGIGIQQVLEDRNRRLSRHSATIELEANRHQAN